MTMTDVTDLSLQGLINDISKRLARLEQETYSASTVGAIPSNISVSSVNVGGTVIQASAPLGPTAVYTTGVSFGDVYIDVTITPASDAQVSTTYQINFAVKDQVAGTYQNASILTSNVLNIRIPGLLPNTIYGMQLRALNALSVASAPSPATGYTNITTTSDPSSPAQVQGLQLSAGYASVVGAWTPNSEPNVAYGAGLYELQVANASTFTPVSTIVSDQTTSGTVITLTGLISGTTYYGRVRAITSSGIPGPWSATASTAAAALPAGSVATAQIVAGTINADRLVSGSITSTLMTANSINGDRISAGTLVADKIATSSLTAATITLAGGKLITGNPATSGTIYDSSGFRGYKAGVLTFEINTNGSATFGGDITSTATISGAAVTGSTITGGLVRSAVSGERVELGVGSGGPANALRFFPAVALTGQAAAATISVITNFTSAYGQNLFLDSGRGSSTAGTGGKSSQLELQPGYGGNYGFALTAQSSYGVVQAGGELRLIAGNDNNVNEASQDITASSYGGSITLYTDAYNRQINLWATNVAVGYNGNYTGQIRVLSTGNMYLESGSPSGPYISSRDTSNNYVPHGASAFNVSSLRETKTEVAALTSSSLDKLLKVKPVYYERRVSRVVKEKEYTDVTKHLGVIAEEVVAQFPDLAAEAEGELMGYQLNGLIAVIMHSVQELHARTKHVQRVA